MLKGLNAIAKPLYKYVFSLSNNLRTRKEGLLDSFVLLDQEDSLAGLTLMAHVRMHSNERHPNLPKRPFECIRTCAISVTPAKLSS